MGQLDQDFARRLAELERKLSSKERDLELHGILHGDVRERAVALKLRLASLQTAASAASQHGTHASAWQSFASDMQSLKLLVEGWVAGIDKGH